jgi:hypothetical protein
MSEARIVYTPRADVTSESEAVALAAVYRFLLDRHAKKMAAYPGGPDDAERRSNEIRANDIIQY